MEATKLMEATFWLQNSTDALCTLDLEAVQLGRLGVRLMTSMIDGGWWSHAPLELMKPP